MAGLAIDLDAGQPQPVHQWLGCAKVALDRYLHRHETGGDEGRLRPGGGIVVAVETPSRFLAEPPCRDKFLLDQ